uniref:Uncharacterized protein n=1 Tax=Anguilla anguilla TaxID=7936 RepID=A0A0E9WBL6_ANGAN
MGYLQSRAGYITQSLPSYSSNWLHFQQQNTAQHLQAKIMVSLKF